MARIWGSSAVMKVAGRLPASAAPYSGSSSFQLKQEWKGEVLFGVAPVFSAIRAKRREMYRLCIQEGLELSKRKDRKLIAEGIRRAQECGIEIQYVSKHCLNMIANGHGFLLDCSALEFEDLYRMPPVEDADSYPIWLALDEVFDPHNLGAMIRTAVFLGVDGVLVAKKNSAPLTPTVSKVSAGAMELFPVHASLRVQKLLTTAQRHGWQIIGSDVTPDAIHFEEYEIEAPTILVMGNEAQGLRHSVRQCCNCFVQIQPSAMKESPLLDSLNVSVAAGILMGQLTASRKRKGHIS